MANEAISQLIQSYRPELDEAAPTSPISMALSQSAIDQPAGETLIAERREQGAKAQADEIRILVEAGINPETNEPFLYERLKPQTGAGWLGTTGSLLERATRRDLIPPIVEKYLDKDTIKKLEDLLGSREFSTPRKDADLLERAGTYLIGRPPTEDAAAQEETALQLAAQRGGIGGYPGRLAKEILGQEPSPAAIEGKTSENLPPHLKAMLRQHPYAPATKRMGDVIELKKYGRTPVKKPEEFAAGVEGAQAAIRWMAEVPFDSKGKSVAEDVVGQILVADMNARYGTPNNQYTLESLELAYEPTTAGNRLTFLHPTEGRQPIDPVHFEWGDLLDQLPWMTVVFGDILGSIVGGLGGYVSPVPGGTFLGGTAGGATGAFVGKLWNEVYALQKKAGFVYDGSKEGFVGKNAKGEEVVVNQMELIFNALDEAAWSAGGATLGTAIFKVAKHMFVTRGADAARNMIPEDEFLEAYESYGKSLFGAKFRDEGIVISPAIVMERMANKVRDEIKRLPPGPERAALVKKATKLEKSSFELHAIEEKALPGAGATREQVISSLEAETTKGIPPAIFETPEEFGKQVIKALQSGDAVQIDRILEQVGRANVKLTDDFATLMGSTAEGDPLTFGRSLAEAASKALGTWSKRGSNTVSAGDTKVGLYGALNILRGQAKIGGRKAWDLTKIERKVQSEINTFRKVGVVGVDDVGRRIDTAYPPEVQRFFLDLQNKVKPGDPISVNIGELGGILEKVDKAIGETSGDTFRRLVRLKEALTKAEGEGFKSISAKLYKDWLAADKNLKDFHNVWTNDIANGLTNNNLDKLAQKIFTTFRDERSIADALEAFSKAGLFKQEQKKLLRNILKAHFRETLAKTEGIAEAGIDVAGKPRAVTIGQEKFTVDTLNAAAFTTFKNQYGKWIKALFPEDPEFEKFSEVIVRGEGLKGRYVKLNKLEKELSNLPWMAGADFQGKSLAEVAVSEPQKLFDMAFSDPLRATKSIKELKRVLRKGLEEDEYGIALSRLKALALRRVYNPDEPFAATMTGGYNLAQVTRRGLDILERESKAYQEIFGPKHYTNLRKWISEIQQVAEPTIPRGLRGVIGFGPTAGESRGKLAEIPLLAAKVYVGVLNTKARALNLGLKWHRKGEESHFERLLTNADELAKVLKIKRKVKGNLAANALGSALGVGYQYANDLIERYTFRDAKGEIQPVPIMTPEQGRAEAIQRMRLQDPLNVTIHPPRGTGVLPGVNQ